MSEDITKLSRRDILKVAGGALLGAVGAGFINGETAALPTEKGIFSESKEHGRAIVVPISKADAEYLLKSVKGNEKAWAKPTIITINHDNPINADGYANQSYNLNVLLPTGQTLNAYSYVKDDMYSNGSSADYNNESRPTENFPINGFSEGANSKVCDLIVDGVRSVWKAEGIQGVHPLGSREIGTPFYKEYTYFALLPNSDGNMLPPKDELDGSLDLIIGVAHNRFTNISGSEGNARFGNALQGMAEGRDARQVSYYRVFSK